MSVGGGEPRPSRVEDASDGLIVLSHPTDASGYQVAGRAGTLVAVTWTSEWGVHEVAGRIVEVVQSPVPQWTVRAEAAQPVHQRREAFRLDLRLRFRLRVEAPGQDGTADVEATAVDLSEGGLGFEVAAGAPLHEGCPVRATLPLDEDEVTLEGRVVRLGEPRDGTCGGGLRFEALTEDLATRVRRYVLQEQIRRRAVVRD